MTGYVSTADAAAADILQDVSQPPVACLAAANLLLDRGYGKSGQHVIADVTQTHEDPLDDMERRVASLGPAPGQRSASIPTNVRVVEIAAYGVNRASGRAWR